MSKLKAILFLFLNFTSVLLFAQTSTIKGVAPEYAGMDIPIYSYSDFISEEKVELGILHFLADGSFSTTFSLSNTIVCFAEFDIYQAMICVEPNKLYQIQFPPRQQKSEAQKRNPFYKLRPVWFQFVNQLNDDINLKIKNFETEFRILEDKYFYDIYQKRSKASVELVRAELQRKFPKTQNKFFEDHKTYRIANLEFALNQGKSPAFINAYFGMVDPKIHLPAYTDLFVQLFTNYFSYLGNSVRDQRIIELVNSGDVQALENYLSVKNEWNADFCQLIILKSLKDAYYSGQFSKPAIAHAYQQVAKTNWPKPNKIIAKNILRKLLYLTEGSDAPNVSLLKFDGQRVSIDEFKGSLVYLHFTDLQNPVCVQHMEALKPIADQFKNNLHVIFITEGKVSTMEAEKWTGIFVASNETVKTAYKVKTFPSSYLIGRDGKLIASPALNPMNGIDSQLRQIIEKERIDRLRKK